MTERKTDLRGDVYLSRITSFMSDFPLFKSLCYLFPDPK